jgi:uncharacterized membrane protein
MIIAFGYFAGVMSLEFLEGHPSLTFQLLLAGVIAMGGIAALKGIWFPKLHVAWVLAFCAAAVALDVANADWAYIFLAIHVLAIFAIIATFRRWTQQRTKAGSVYRVVGALTVVFLLFGFISGYYTFIPSVMESAADQRVINSVRIGDTFDSVCASVKANGASPLGCIPQGQYRNEEAVVLPLLTMRDFCVTSGMFSIEFVNERVSKKRPWSITCGTPVNHDTYRTH